MKLLLIPIIAILINIVQANDQCTNKFAAPLNCIEKLHSIHPELTKNFLSYHQSSDGIVGYISRLMGDRKKINLFTIPAKRDGYYGLYLVHDQGITWQSISIKTDKELAPEYKLIFKYPTDSKKITIHYAIGESTPISYSLAEQEDKTSQRIEIKDLIDEQSWQSFENGLEKLIVNIVNNSVVYGGTPPEGAIDDSELLRQCLTQLNTSCESHQQMIIILQRSIEKITVRKEQILKVIESSQSVRKH